MARRTSRRNTPAGVVTGALGSPFLAHVSIVSDRTQPDVHPFSMLLFENGLDLAFTTPVTFRVGGNGSGKSSMLEAIAWASGFGEQGGSRDRSFAEGADGHTLGRALKLAWRQPVTDGFILRVLQIEDGRSFPTSYERTEHYELTRGFLDDPAKFYRFLLVDDEDDDKPG